VLAPVSPTWAIFPVAALRGNRLSRSPALTVPYDSLKHVRVTVVYRSRNSGRSESILFVIVYDVRPRGPDSSARLHIRPRWTRVLVDRFITFFRRIKTGRRANVRIIRIFRTTLYASGPSVYYNSHRWWYVYICVTDGETVTTQ